VKLFVRIERFLPEVAAVVCFAIATATKANAAATQLIALAALAIILAIKFGPESVELSRQRRRGEAKALLGANRNKGNR
jgi:hypothetical protein